MKKLTDEQLQSHFFEFQQLFYPDYSYEEIEKVRIQVLDALEDKTIKSISELNEFLDENLEHYFWKAGQYYYDRLHLADEFPYKILLLWLEEISQLESAVENSDTEKISVYKNRAAHKMNTLFDILNEYYDNSKDRTELEKRYFTDRISKYIERYRNAILK